MSIKGIWEKFLYYMKLPEVPEDYDLDTNATSDNTSLELSETSSEEHES